MLLLKHFGVSRPSLAGWRRVAASSLPLFGLGILTMVQLRVDSTLLGLLRSYVDVATYEASARLFEASQAVIRPLTIVFLPICAALAAAGAYAHLGRSALRLSLAALAVGGFVALVVTAIADQVVLAVYGAGYAASADVLRVHFAATPFLFVGAVALFHVTAMRRERSALFCAGGGVLINIALDLLLIPGHGAVGAAWATLAAEAATTVGLSALAWLALVGAERARPGTAGAPVPQSL